ncbi:MAG: hypothetical protein WCK89_17315, partial [bacterium]
RDAKDVAKVTPMRPEAVAPACAGLLDVRTQTAALLVTMATDPNLPGVPVLAVEGQLFKADADGRAATDGFAAGVAGIEWLYHLADGKTVPAIPSYTPGADTEKMNEAQLVTNQANEKIFGNLLQTLDASKLAGGRYGAISVNGKVYYRGGENDAVIGTNAAVQAAKPVAGWYSGGTFTPLISEYATRNVKALAGTACTLTEEMVGAGLKRLAGTGVKGAVYVAHGQVWELGTDGKLTSKVEKVAGAVSWALGHDVRPARQARGAKPAKCADCHTADSKFFFAQVESTGPLLTARKLVQAQCEFMALSGSYNKVFGTTFLMRPVFKIFLWVVFAIVLLVAVAFVAAAVPGVLAKGVIPYGKPCEKLMVRSDKLAAAGLCAASVYLGVSGLAGWLFHLLTGYLLIFHMVAGGLFAACLVALIGFRGAKRIVNNKRNVLWLLILVLGVGVLFTAAAPMMTWFGEGWQQVMTSAHRYTTMAFLVVSAWMMISGGRKE